MGIAVTLRDYLDNQGMEYELVEHPYTTGSQRTAQVMHIPGDRIAKSVVLADDYGYVMAVVPATHHVELDLLERLLHRDLCLVPEQELSGLFDDCEIGAIPPVGDAYGIQVLVDERLAELSDVYFEAGDHTDLVHMHGDDFRSLMAGAEHGEISHHL